MPFSLSSGFNIVADRVDANRRVSGILIKTQNSISLMPIFYICTVRSLCPSSSGMSYVLFIKCSPLFLPFSPLVDRFPDRRGCPAPPSWSHGWVSHGSIRGAGRWAEEVLCPVYMTGLHCSTLFVSTCLVGFWYIHSWISILDLKSDFFFSFSADHFIRHSWIRGSFSTDKCQKILCMKLPTIRTGNSLE